MCVNDLWLRAGRDKVASRERKVGMGDSLSKAWMYFPRAMSLLCCCISNSPAFLASGEPWRIVCANPAQRDGREGDWRQLTWIMDLECCGARNWTLRAAYRARNGMLDGCRANLGTPLDRGMQQLVDNDEASMQHLGILSYIDENIP